MTEKPLSYDAWKVQQELRRQAKIEEFNKLKETDPAFLALTETYDKLISKSIHKIKSFPF
jgi:hypothetical protein